MHTEYTIQAAQNQEAADKILHDVSSTGKVRPWRQHRIEAKLLAEAYSVAAQQLTGPASIKMQLRADAVSSCATDPIFRRFRQPDGSQLLRLHTANFCRDRLCPMCQWRRSLKMAAQARAVVAKCNEMKWLRDQSHYKKTTLAAAPQQVKGYRWIMLTLTQRNVEGPELSTELDKMSKALSRLVRRKEWAPIKGWLRATETTHNTQRWALDATGHRYKIDANGDRVPNPWYDTYHPHIHLMLAVNSSYLKSKQYIKQKDWVRLWRECMGLDYDPSIDVHVIKPRDGDAPAADGEPDADRGIGAAVAEVSKYASKPSSYLVASDLELTVSAVTTLAAALKGKRLTAWGGVCKEAAAQLALDDIEGGDLTHINDDPATADPTADAAAEYIEYHWAAGIRNYTAGRTFEGPAEWQQAAQKKTDKTRLKAHRRAQQEADFTDKKWTVHRLQRAIGADVAGRLIHGHDTYMIQKFLPKTEVLSPCPDANDDPPTPQPPST